MVSVACGSTIYTVSLNEEFAAADAIGRLQSAKAVFGAVAVPSPETERHSVAFLALTTPSAGGLEILIVRPSGAEVLAGVARPGGSEVEFTLRAVRRPGAAGIAIEGGFDGTLLRIAQARVSSERLPGITPARKA